MKEINQRLVFTLLILVGGCFTWSACSQQAEESGAKHCFTLPEVEVVDDEACQQAFAEFEQEFTEPE